MMAHISIACIGHGANVLGFDLSTSTGSGLIMEGARVLHDDDTST